MIAHVSGTVTSRDGEILVVDVGGVGYEVTATLTALSRCEPGMTVTVPTYLHVREDAMLLFGFSNDAERRIFRLLLGVNGVGPKLALAIVSAQDPDRNYWGLLPIYGETPAEIAEWRAHQRAAAGLSTDSSFVIVNRSAHVIEHDRPDAVIAGVRTLVIPWVARVRMPQCSLSAYGSQPLC